MSKIRLEAVVFITGAVVMIFELVGSRVLAPSLGGSIHVWTSLIGVILGSLSLGYWYGGKLADRRPEQSLLSSIILGAAAFVVLVAYGGDASLAVVRSLFSDLRLASVVAALVLFAPASVLLGMVIPFAVRLEIEDVRGSGALVGRLYAISTIGSIVGTFLAGFFLISYLGTTRILLVLSLLLVMAALLIRGRMSGSKIGTKAVLVVLAVLGRVWLAPVLETGRTMIDTDYNRVIIEEMVEEDSGLRVRLLCFDDLFSQSGVYVDNPETLYEGYTPFYRLAEHFRPDARRSLLIGGGAFTHPRDYLRRNPHSRIDVVELDPALTEISRSYFFLRNDPRLNIYHEDGRTFVTRSNEAYDVVFLDAFTSAATVPFHLTTVQFTKQVRRILLSDGLLLVNVLSAIEGPQGRLLRALYRTYRSLFEQVCIFPVDDPVESTVPQNLIIVALKGRQPAALGSEDEELGAYLEHRWQGDIPEDLPLLTDDFAPVTHYMLGTIQHFFEDAL